ncbi:MAG: hypothetical protein EHM57_01635 [Actinobacteria bacterium]|nr:MAG: hypothetical protein EHM57_01635 [Actinomycetota bacterium]
MKRRDFLKYTAGAVGGISVAVAADAMGLGAAALAAPSASGDAAHDHGAAGSPAVVVDDFASRGRRVQIVRRGEETRMRIDGRELSHHHFMKDGSVYRSHLLPFREDRRARDLAAALVEDDGVLFVL